MTRRMEQSRKHGHHDPRWTGRLHAVSESPPLPDAPEEPTRTPPTLTLVGGTDIAAKTVGPIATLGI